jgi:hypothetical protein
MCCPVLQFHSLQVGAEVPANEQPYGLQRVWVAKFYQSCREIDLRLLFATAEKNLLIQLTTKQVYHHKSLLDHLVSALILTSMSGNSKYYTVAFMLFGM